MLTRISMLVAFSVPNLEKWGYTNSTLFIDPLQPEFQARSYSSDDSTEEAINKKIAWLYSTDPYNHDNIAGIYSALDAYSKGEYWTQSSNDMPSSAWTTLKTVVTTPPASIQVTSSGTGHVTPVPSPTDRRRE